MSMRGEKYETYKDKDYERIYTMKQLQKTFEEVQQMYPRLKKKTFYSINSYEKKSPLKKFKKEVQTIVIEQVLQNPKLNTLLLEKEKKQIKKLLRRLISIQYGPNGVKRPEGKENKELRRSKGEILKQILKTFELHPIPVPSLQRQNSQIEYDAQSILDQNSNYSNYFQLDLNKEENSLID